MNTDNLYSMYLKTHPVIFNCALSYVIDKGMTNVVSITDEQIASVNENAICTAEFNQEIVRTAREIARICGCNAMELINFCSEWVITSVHPVSWHRMSEIAEEAISYMKDNDILDDFIEDRCIDLDLDGNEAEYFGIHDEDEDDYDDYDDDDWRLD